MSRRRMNFSRPVFSRIDNAPDKDYSIIKGKGKNLQETIQINERMVRCLVYIKDYNGSNRFIKQCVGKRYLSKKQIDTIRNILIKENISKLT